MLLVHIFRPEVRGPYDGRTEDWEAYQSDPFEGIELLGICNTDEEANELIDAYDNGKWKFHIEPVRDDMLANVEFPGFGFVVKKP